MVAIEEIYDAAFDRRRFEQLLVRMVSTLGGSSGFLAWSEVTRHSGFQVQTGNDPAWLRRYVEEYWQHDVLRPILYAADEGQVIAAHPHLQRAEIRDSVFYREYLAPQRIVDNLAVNLIKRSNMIATLAILRVEPAEPFGAAEHAALARLVPHLTRAVYLQSHLIERANVADGYRQTAIGARDHLLLLGEDLRVVEVDPQLAVVTGLRLGEGVGSGVFGSAIREALAIDAPIVAEIIEDDGAVVRLLCEAQVLARDAFGDLIDGPGATHAIHVSRVDRPRRIAYRAIATLHRLTPTEARVLESAVEHGDLVAIGDRLGMARATARTHLHRIYDKTGTSGFADLCRFAHRFVQSRPEMPPPS